MVSSARGYMAPKPGYRQPGRKGLVAVVVWLKPEERDALKIAAIEGGTTIQAVLEQAAIRYAEGGKSAVRDRRKPKR